MNARMYVDDGCGAGAVRVVDGRVASAETYGHYWMLGREWEELANFFSYTQAKVSEIEESVEGNAVPHYTIIRATGKGVDGCGCLWCVAWLNRHAPKWEVAKRSRDAEGDLLDLVLGLDDGPTSEVYEALDDDEVYATPPIEVNEDD